MKMAKASEYEIDMALKLSSILNNVESGDYPMPIDDETDCEDEPTFFNPEDQEHLRVFYDRVMACMNAAPGGLFRVVGGFHTLMHNDIVDPNQDVLELHPRLEKALEALKKNDPVRSLISAHAQLLDANPYCYFELAYTRRTEWMAWLCSKPSEDDPDRIVLAKGQGSSPDSAATDALNSIKIDKS